MPKAVKKTPKKKAPERRRRLSAENAREAILAATEKRLRDAGPDALRLQEIAKDVGLSHPTVLHHVGSREALVAAVVARSLLALETDLIAAFMKNPTPMEMASTLHNIDDVMRIRGQARLVAWLALTRPGAATKKESRMGEVVLALHAARSSFGPPAPYEDTAFAALLSSVAMFGLAIIGPALIEMMHLPNDEETMRRFREWFAALMVEHGGMPAQAG